MGAIPLFCVLLAGCEYSTTELKSSPEMTESAEVADLVYTPSNHGSGVNPSLHMTDNGDLGVGVTFTSVDIPEKYAIVFMCRHGKFIIQSDQEKTKALWQRLKAGQRVVVRYREVYREEALVKTDWGREVSRKPTARVLEKYDFIDAN